MDLRGGEEAGDETGALDLDGCSGGRRRRDWTDIEVGDRSEETFLKLYNRLPEAARHVSNGYVVYDLLPANRHVIGKGLEANRNEGRHSALRDKLNRLHRGTKGYSKSEEALRGSVALICLQQAWI